MDRQMNPFALLGEDDDGDNDLTALIKTAAAKNPKPEKKLTPEKEKPQSAKLPSKPLPPAEAVRAERGRGRGPGRGRGRGFGGGGEFSNEFGGRGGGRGFGDSSNGYGGRGGGRGFGDSSNEFGGRGGGRGFGEEDGGGGGGGGRGFGRGRGRGRGRGGGRFGGGFSNEANGTDDSPRPQFEAEATADQWPTEGSAEEHKTVEPEAKKPEEEITRETSLENKEENKEEEDKEMTLDEYEKVLSEKRKALESTKNEERKVVRDRDFESMQLVDRKKDVGIFIKLNSEKDKLKKKENIDKEEKARKAVSINEFLKPADGDKYYGPLGGVRGRGRGRGRVRGNGTITRGSFTGRFNDADEVALPHIEDPVQFPVLTAK